MPPPNINTMLLRVDSTRLHETLVRHAPDIGHGTIRNAALTAIEGAFLIPSATAVGNAPVRWLLLALATAATVSGIVETAKAMRRRTTAETLYKEITDMDRTSKRSSLIAVTDGAGRYLAYHDDGWGCWFLPNHATADDEDTNAALIRRYLHDAFGLGAGQYDLRRVTSRASEKRSAEHGGEPRHYEYTLYEARMRPGATIPQGSLPSGVVCRWMTMRDMRSDKRTEETNKDVLDLLRDSL